MAGSEQTAAEHRRLPARRRRRRGDRNLVGIMGWREASEAISNRDTGQMPFLEVLSMEAATQ